MSDETNTQAEDRGDLVMLAHVLQEARLARGWSLRAAARAAGLNPMQLSRLERGESKAPSPHILYQLGNAFNLPYAELMRLSGYATPATGGNYDDTTTTGVEQALGAEGVLLRAAAPFTEDELEAMLAFLRFYRQRNSAHVQPRVSEPSDDQQDYRSAPARLR